jgi:hypothetical protein
MNPCQPNKRGAPKGLENPKSHKRPHKRERERALSEPWWRRLELAAVWWRLHAACMFDLWPVLVTQPTVFFNGDATHANFIATRSSSRQRGTGPDPGWSGLDPIGTGLDLVGRARTGGI